MIYFISGQKRVFETPDIKTATIEDLLIYFEDKEIISFDSETTGFDPHTDELLSVQLGDYENQYVVDCTTIDVMLLKPLLESGKLIIFHNAQFDLKFLLRKGIDVKNLYDTFVAELVLTTGYEHRDKKSKYYAPTNLAAVSSKYTEAKLDKSIRANIHREGLTDRVIIYGADDVKYLSKIREKQLVEINNWSLNSVLDLENSVTRVFAIMSCNGIKLDTVKWEEVYDITFKAVNDLTEELDKLVKEEPLLNKYVPQGVQGNLFGFEERELFINWGSPSQKLQILKDLGIEIESVGDRDLQKNKHKHVLVKKLIEYSKMAKLANAFGKDFLKHVNKKTGKLHMNVWQILSTGRIAVSNPNLNQIPSKGDLAPVIRSAFIPENGYKIVGGDYSSFELAIIAEFSKDPVWINTLKEGKNLHSELAAMTFDVPVEDVKNPFPPKPDLTYRAVQKTIDFGLAYGMSEFKLADTMQVPIEEAKATIEKFFSKVPEVKRFLENLGELGKKRGYIKSSQPFGRIRFFPEWLELQENPNHKDKFKILGSIERRSKNMPIQGSNGDVIKLALIKVQEEIDKNNWPVRILLSVYDEIQTECKEEKTEEWKKVLQKIMIDAAKEILKEVPIEVDVEISDYWKK